MFLTYDITRQETFHNVIEWLKDVRQHASADVLVYLVGNRNDLEEMREVEKETANNFCLEFKIDKLFETSAKTGKNVEDLFSFAAKELYLQQK